MARSQEVKESKLARLKALAAECNKALGADGKVYLGSEHPEYARIPTGMLAFDVVTGGGLVRRGMVEIYGEDSAGKTLVALNAVAAVQRRKGVCVWVKGEDLDVKWAARLGVNVGKLILVEASVGDKALETACSVLEDGDPDLLVFDSFQSLGTTREAEGGVDSEAYAGGGAPQLWGRVSRRIYAAFNGGRTSAAIIGISQVRDAIGMFSPNGKPEPQPTRIRALRHMKAISVQCKKGEPVYSDKSAEKRRLLSREFSLKCVKNKTASTEQRVASYVFNFRGHEGGVFGVDHATTALRLGKAYGVLGSKGSWVEGYGLREQGDEKFRARLRENPEILERLAADVLTVALE